MSYLVDLGDDAITLRVSLQAQLLATPAGPVSVHRLGVPLSFSRKAADLSEVGGSGDLQHVYIGARAEISTAQFDAFARQLCADAPHWLLRARDALPALSLPDGVLCVMVAAYGRPLLFVDCAGCSYARYVARLG